MGNSEFIYRGFETVYSANFLRKIIGRSLYMDYCMKWGVIDT